MMSSRLGPLVKMSLFLLLQLPSLSQMNLLFYFHG